MPKYFCFRFDVDTHRCLRKGVPNLLHLAEKLGVSFTFFINAGRAVSRVDYVKNIFYKRESVPEAKKLSNIKKLGLVDFLVAGILNPVVGSDGVDMVKLASSKGHEIGLHGGLNHATWQNQAVLWTKERIISEVSEALKRIKRMGVRPKGFSSPDWQDSPHLNQILESLGFEYTADVHGEELERIEKAQNCLRLLKIPTNILGEPGGVGYLENCRAKNMSDEEVIDDFNRRLQNKNLAVVYDHPCFAGTKELSLIEKIIKVAQSAGFEMVTLQKIANKNSGLIV